MAEGRRLRLWKCALARPGDAEGPAVRGPFPHGGRSGRTRRLDLRPRSPQVVRPSMISGPRSPETPAMEIRSRLRRAPGPTLSRSPMPTSGAAVTSTEATARTSPGRRPSPTCSPWLSLEDASTSRSRRRMRMAAPSSVRGTRTPSSRRRSTPGGRPSPVLLARETMGAAKGSWVGTEPIAYGYQWRRRDADGSNCVDIGGATLSTYAHVPRGRPTGPDSRGRDEHVRRRRGAFLELRDSRLPHCQPTCKISNRTSWSLGGSDCQYGTLIKLSNEFRCSQPLSSYGPLPIKVVWTFTSASTSETRGTSISSTAAAATATRHDRPDRRQQRGRGHARRSWRSQFRTAGPRDIQVTASSTGGPLGDLARTRTSGSSTRRTRTQTSAIVNGYSATGGRPGDVHRRRRGHLERPVRPRRLRRKVRDVQPRALRCRLGLAWQRHERRIVPHRPGGACVERRRSCLPGPRRVDPCISTQALQPSM